MSSSSSSSGGGGIGFVGLLTIAFVVLKLLKKLSWSWWWVLSPIWISFLLFVVIMVFAAIYVIKKKNSTKGRLDAYARRVRGDRGEVGAVLVIIACIILAIGIGIGIYFLVYATASGRGRIAAHNQTNTGTYRIAAYDHFFNLCAGVQDREAAIRNAQEEAKTASQARKEQLAAVITANRNERADLINQYNADANKTATQGQFVASNLPYQLSLNIKETKCTA